MIEFSCEGDGQSPCSDPNRFADLPAVTDARAEDGGINLSVKVPHLTLPALMSRLETMNCQLTNLTTRHASLEDVFVKLAGHHLDGADADVAAKPNGKSPAKK